MKACHQAQATAMQQNGRMLAPKTKRMLLCVLAITGRSKGCTTCLVLHEGQKRGNYYGEAFVHHSRELHAADY